LIAAIVCEKVPVIAIFAMSLTQRLVADPAWPDLTSFGRIWMHLEINCPGARSVFVRAWRTLPLKIVLDNGCPEKPNRCFRTDRDPDRFVCRLRSRRHRRPRRPVILTYYEELR